MAKDHVEVWITTSIDSGELVGFLEDHGCLGAVDGEGSCSLYWTSESWCEAACLELKRVLTALGDSKAADTLITREIPDQNWNSRWTASLRPICLGRRLFVRQSWNSVAAPDDAIVLVIDPRRAFGTGYHATTQLMIGLLEDRLRGGEKVLDVGTGSGILAMAALRLGARRALAIDNDPEAIECACEYAAVNGFGAELELRVGTLEESEPETFDLLLANLDVRTLPGYFNAFHSWLNPGGAALISGLLRDDYREICQALAVTGWRIAGMREKEEWLALELCAADEHGGQQSA